MRIKWLDKIGFFLMRNRVMFGEREFEITLRFRIADSHSSSSSKNMRTDNSIKGEQFADIINLVGWQQKGRGIALDNYTVGEEVRHALNRKFPNDIKDPHDKETMF